jgi:hypothetical protein
MHTIAISLTQSACLLQQLHNLYEHVTSENVCFLFGGYTVFIVIGYTKGFKKFWDFLILDPLEKKKKIYIYIYIYTHTKLKSV